MTSISRERGGFDALLSLLDPHDREAAGVRYEELRTGLVRFFRWRGAITPEELADETLNRVARRIGEGAPVDDARVFALGVARMILLEEAKARVRDQRLIDEWRREVESSPEPDDERMACLEKCLDSLPPDSRQSILEYYTGERGSKIDNRKLLAARLGMPLPSLRIRVHRLRERLEQCVSICVTSGGMK
jgi:DNA-directed RNA polymerase specialized sigma24 family protein